VRGGPTTAEFALRLKVVTPILGGSAAARQIDQVDVIRVPEIRGHLRFWWRALLPRDTGFSAKGLAQRERKLWGGQGDESGGRSAVEVWVDVDEKTSGPNTKDVSEVILYSKRDQPATTGSYALWPARGKKGGRGEAAEETAPRRKSGVSFTLHVRCSADGSEEEVANSIRAWILFGGYGSRTRRGVGSLTIAEPEQCKAWLPAKPTRDEFARVFGRDIFLAPVSNGLLDVPGLGGAGLSVIEQRSDAERCWETALNWLNDFRQGRGVGRDQGDKKRPGVSRWPEPDKVRRISQPIPGRPWQHEPRHNSIPVWPRAGFGLPIISRFQQKDRQKDNYPKPEPVDYEIHWLRGEKEMDRLASPLIVKALPLADGTFVPCALWLARSYPQDGMVMLKDSRSDSGRSRRSKAEFDQLVAQGDNCYFEPIIQAKDKIVGKPSGMRLRTVFMEWLKSDRKCVEVAP